MVLRRPLARSREGLNDERLLRRRYHSHRTVFSVRGERNADAIEHRSLGNGERLCRNVLEARADDEVDDVSGVVHDLP